MSDVFFHRHGAMLAGTLWLPTTRLHAALVMLTGSGPMVGDCDARVPVAASVAAFEAAFREAGNHAGKIVVFPGADHRLQIGNPPTFAPAYLETMTQWIGQQVQEPTPV